MDENSDVVSQFFAAYAKALLDRDVEAIAAHYAVPALIEFPGQRIVVTEAAQTVDFFARALAQYVKVTEADAVFEIAAAADHSIWVEVTWDYHGAVLGERNMYQLVRIDGGWKIAVLTPLSLS
ncbi:MULTISPECIES: nuclear transport factor 2 family protein [unclassified Brevibacterium]|uniref:nuclear transport factor 2 family protein n=2 Tax=Brevibacterium TaxID=1696 RepID=UPI001E372160|nr:MULTISPECIES: nuclear transport factor 2 family protein [unclassified Brevibacterium]MCD1286027.1 hypothetical protein [Brevibacterium sp. CCUG 69071]MDK8433379.1 nuclear transport factor 2 family protein [Brevibacterium sp. H-BE7]